MLRTFTEQKFFPANTIHISQTNLTNGTQKLAATSNRYIYGGSAVTDTAAVSHAMSFSLSLYSSSSHAHDISPFDEYAGTTPFSLQSSGYSIGGTNHTHAVSATATITDLKGKLLKLWITAAKQLPKTTTVVMYCGDLSILPVYWKVCDGTNGTVDMRGYFLGYATSAATAHGAVTSETTTYSYTGPTVASDAYTHGHYQNGGSYYYTQMYKYHQTGTNSHTHALNGGVVTSDAFPANIKLAFIQLVI
jgi:hypothetical protein